MKKHIAIVLILICLCGCSDTVSTEQLKTYSNQLAQTSAQIHGALDEASRAKNILKVQLEAEPEGETRDKILAAIAKIDEQEAKYYPYVEQIDTKIQTLNNLLAGATDNLDVIQTTVNTGAGFLPPPWNVLASFAGGLAIMGIRSYQNRKAAKSIAKSIEKTGAGVTLRDNAAVVNSIQTETAKRIVDEVQGTTKITLPL